MEPGFGGVGPWFGGAESRAGLAVLRFHGAEDGRVATERFVFVEGGEERGDAIFRRGGEAAREHRAQLAGSRRGLMRTAIWVSPRASRNSSVGGSIW